MPITELVFPLYKLDPQSLAGLKEKTPEIFQSFSGVEGLQAAFRGPILEEDGAAVDLQSMRSVLVLGRLSHACLTTLLLTWGVIDWDTPSSFHNFFPNSPNFKAFVTTIKPFLAGPATPELYEAEERSASCKSSNITQIIKATSTKETEDMWKQLEGAITESATDKPSFYHAKGIEKDEGTFLGLIGWKNLQVRRTSDMKHHNWYHNRNMNELRKTKAFCSVLENWEKAEFFKTLWLR